MEGGGVFGGGDRRLTGVFSIVFQDKTFSRKKYKGIGAEYSTIAYRPMLTCTGQGVVMEC